MRKIIRYIKNWFKNRQNKKNMKKRMKDIKDNDPFIYQ
jgi:hypothetical protein